MSEGVLPFVVRMQRVVTYFGDIDGMKGLMKHVGDEEANCETLKILWETREDESVPYKPFADWPEVEDVVFTDLVRRMACLDPKRRITAREALQHQWFSENNDT